MVPTPIPPRVLRLLGPPPTDADRNADFLNRATFGYTLEEHDRLNAMGRAAWVTQQLSPTLQDNLIAMRSFAPTPIVRYSGQAYYEQYASTASLAAREFSQATIIRAVHSTWQLRERMVDFWHDHFSVSLGTSPPTRLGHHEYDRSVIRAHVFGRFEDMLLGTAKSMSMLEYLNGDENTATGPNENYAREVMELHTLGVNGPYSEADVQELARCLTGWTYWNQFDDTNAGQFRFRAERHDVEAKVFLGIQIPAGGGVNDGEIALRELSSHPSTVDFIARKLARRFLSEDAPEAVIDALKDAWNQSGGNLRTVTEVLFSDRLSDLAEPWNHRKVKRPFQFAAGLIRALGGRSDNGYRPLYNRMDDMGQALFGWPAPNGYPDSSAAWSGDLYTRWRFASDFTRDRLDGMRLPDSRLDQLRDGVPISQLAARLDLLLTGGRSAPAGIQEIQDWIDSRGNFNTRDFRDALGMIASGPDFFLT